MQQKSQPLPYWIFLVAGGLIAGYAGFIVLQGAENANAMNLFLYIGLAFILVGLIKLIFALTSKKSLTDEITQIPQINKQEQKINKYYNNPNTQQQFIYCSKCGARSFASATFCSRCGARLR